jgi:hypothetical protein
MNAKERFLAIYSDSNRKDLDRVPTFVQDVKPEFCTKYEDQMFENFNGELFYSVKFDAPFILGFDAVFAGLPTSVQVETVDVEDENGKKVAIGESGQVSRHGSSYYGGGALTSLENLNKLRSGIKKVDNSKAIQETIKYYEIISDRIFPVCMIGGIFDRVWQAMGMTTFAKNFRKNTPLYRELVKYFAEITKANVQGVIDATGNRAKVINLLDDVAFKGRSMIPPDRWDSDFLPYYKEINGMIKDMGMIPQLHTDGDITELIPSFQKAGFRGLQGWEGGADPVYINEHYPDFVVIGIR